MRLKGKKKKGIVIKSLFYDKVGEEIRIFENLGRNKEKREKEKRKFWVFE